MSYRVRAHLATVSRRSYTVVGRHIDWRVDDGIGGRGAQLGGQRAGELGKKRRELLEAAADPHVAWSGCLLGRAAHLDEETNERVALLSQGGPLLRWAHRLRVGGAAGARAGGGALRELTGVITQPVHLLAQPCALRGSPLERGPCRGELITTRLERRLRLGGPLTLALSGDLSTGGAAVSVFEAGV
jgi:hypothetical protein